MLSNPHDRSSLTLPIETMTNSIHRGIARVAAWLMTTLVATSAYAQFQPNITFNSLLNGVSVNLENGQLMIDKLYAGFLPEGHGALTCAVYKEGEELAVYPTMFITEGKPFSQFIVNSYGNEVTLEEGDYTLVFALGGEPFYEFPFSARIKDNGDAYDPKRLPFLDGAWTEYAALYFKTPDQTVTWRVPYRNEDLSVRQKNGVRQIDIYRDGKHVATSEEDTSQKIGVPVTGYHTWYISKVKLFNVLPDHATTPLYGRDLLACGDCSYEVRVQHWDAYLYKEASMNDGAQKRPNVTQTDTYAFRVAGGQIVREGRQDREQTDPLSFIEGGKTMTWLKRKEGS